MAWIPLAVAAVSAVASHSGSSSTTTGPQSTEGHKTVEDTGVDVSNIGIKGEQKTTGTSATTTAGSQNSTNTTNYGGVDVVTNSGSTNTRQTSASQNVNTTDAARNVTTNSGSVNTIVDAARTNRTVNSGRVDTVQTLLSQEAVDHVVKGILEGTQGLAAVSSGQKVSGGYNTTTNMQLVNDLVSRTAGEVAQRSAATQTTVGSSFIDQILGEGKTTQTIGGSSTVQDIGATRGVQNIGGVTTTENIGGSATVNRHGNSATETITNIGATNSNTNTSAVTGPSTDINLVRTGPRVVTENSTSVSSPTTTDTKKGWIICTELYKQGRLPHRHYIPGSRKFATYDEQIKRGYYLWAVPSVVHLHKYPNSLYSHFLEWVFINRAEYIAAQSHVTRARKTIAGFITLVTVHAFCYVLSRTIARTYNYTPNNVYGD